MTHEELDIQRLDDHQRYCSACRAGRYCYYGEWLVSCIRGEAVLIVERGHEIQVWRKASPKWGEPAYRWHVRWTQGSSDSWFDFGDARDLIEALKAAIAVVESGKLVPAIVESD